VGETHHRKALAGLKIGGFHPPRNIDFPTLTGTDPESMNVVFC